MSGNNTESEVDLEKTRTIYSTGIQTQSVSDLSADKAIQLTGELIDSAGILQKEEGLEHALDLADQTFGEKGLSEKQEARLHYFVGNAHSALDQLDRREASKSEIWAQNWERPKIEPVILNYRRAANHPGFDSLPVPRRCQVLTNLGNTLNSVGRSIDALRHYDKVLSLLPSFMMARGNRAFTSGLYAQMFYDKGHALTFFRFAYADLATASSGGDYIEPDARRGFQEYMEQLKSVVGGPEKRCKVPNLYDFEVGDSREETRYRRWCLRHRLFLNPLNDLGPYSIAAQDVLHMPPIVTDIETGPKYHGAFNQLKQGFVSARFQLYSGIASDEPHFSDRNVLLYNTLDYPSYSLAIEKVKLAFRSFYSLFDQIAFLLNDYLGLEIPSYRTDFRTLWYKGEDQNQGIKEDLADRQNRALQALFWLSKDLYEKRDEFREALDPAARRLAEIRNCLEHRYLKVHDIHLGEPDSDTARAVRYDDLAESIDRRDFEQKTLRIASAARSALIYLSLAMHIENVTVRKQKLDGTAMPRQLDIWEDEWKR
jgi:hypothetical protein